MRAGVLPLLLSVTLGLAVSVSAQTPPPDAVAERARDLHRRAIVIDTHIDTTWRLTEPGWSFLDRHDPPVPGATTATGRPAGNHVDLPRMREGGLDAAFFSIFVPGTVTGPVAVKRAIEQIDAVRGLAERHPDRLVFAASAADVRAAHAAGRTAVLMGMEGGHMIDDSLAALRTFARLGVRYLTLTHSVNTGWADSSSDTPRHGGLTAFGREVVAELNRLGVMVDVSHVSDEAFRDALEASRAPLIASHSSCRAISGHPRNMSDEMITALAAKGGVIQINFLDAYLDHDLYLAQDARQKEMAPLRKQLEEKYPGEEHAAKRRQELRAAMAQMSPLPRPSWEKIVEHIDHAVKLVGAEHVGLGSDFDGATMPIGMEDASRLPKITEALLRKGYTDAQVRGILGENVLRLMERVEAVGVELRGATGSAALR